MAFSNIQKKQTIIMNKKLLTLLFFGVLMMALDIAIMGPALPTLKNAFGVDDRQISWVFGIYLLFNLVSNPLMGRLSDLYGRRVIYSADLAIFGLGSLIISLSNSFEMLLIGRAVQGIGAGGIFPVASAVIGDSFPKERQGWALGLIGAVFGLAFMLGPIIGGVFLMYGWRLIFVGNLPFCVALVYFSLKIMPNKKKDASLSFDWIGSAMLMVSLASFAYSVNQIDASNLLGSIVSIDAAPFFILPVILLPIFYNRQKKVPIPALNPLLFKNKQLVLTYLITFFASLPEISVVFLPSMAKAWFDVTDSQASFMMLPAVASMFIGAPTAGKLIDKAGPRTVIVIGIHFITAGMAGLYFLGSNITSFFVFTGLVGFGLASLAGSPLRYIVIREAGEADRASAQSLINIFKSSGQLLFAAFLGAMIASFSNTGGALLDGYLTAFLISGILTYMLLFAVAGLKSRKKSNSAISE